MSKKYKVGSAVVGGIFVYQVLVLKSCFLFFTCWIAENYLHEDAAKWRTVELETAGYTKEY